MRYSIYLTIALSLTMMVAPAGAQSIRLSTENDILTQSGPIDDLYTFSIAIDVDSHGFTGSLHENAFTDRAAGIRFDETYLSVRRPTGTWHAWDVAVETGVVHVGKGLFGQRMQNAVHRVVGSEEVDLPYVDSSLYGRVAASAARSFDAEGRLTWGARVDVDVAPGLRSWALVAVEGRWQASQRVAIEAQGGGRFANVSYAALEPHIATSAPAGRVSVVFDDRIYVIWSYNDYGDEREHVSVGYRVPLGGWE